MKTTALSKLKKGQYKKSRQKIGRKSKKVTVCIQNYLVQNCQKFPFFLVANEVHAAQVFFLRKNIFNFFFLCNFIQYVFYRRTLLPTCQKCQFCYCFKCRKVSLNEVRFCVSATFGPPEFLCNFGNFGLKLLSFKVIFEGNEFS